MKDSKDKKNIFPRLGYLRLNESLIQAHLDIFEQFRHIFTAYLELRESLSSQPKPV